MSELGRDESKHIKCKYVGRESSCPDDCSKCAISIKTDGDKALAQNKIQEAIRYYKKAVFIEPQFAEAWCNLGNSYGMIPEYNNALSAFNKAIAIDPKYGKALFGKAITLQNLGRINEALSLADNILCIYEDTNVEEFKAKLTFADARDEKHTLNRANTVKKLLMSDNENKLEVDLEIIHELSKIEDEIQSIENKLEQSFEIRFEESKKANVPLTGYERNQRSLIMNLQKRFNRILEEYGLNTIIAKQIIDTFDDFKWYDEEQKHYWLEKVEIDIEKRLKSTELKRKCLLLAENNMFAFYFCNGVILRESIKSGDVVYFGTGSGVMGSILGNKFYWFDGTSICGDNMIYRADFNRSTVEHLDWISNEKAWLSGHLMSEDRVNDMHTIGNKLIISVSRQSEHGGQYRIIVSERNEKLYVTKELVEGNFDI